MLECMLLYPSVGREQKLKVYMCILRRVVLEGVKDREETPILQDMVVMLT